MLIRGWGEDLKQKLVQGEEISGSNPSGTIHVTARPSNETSSYVICFKQQGEVLWARTKVIDAAVNLITAIENSGPTDKASRQFLLEKE